MSMGAMWNNIVEFGADPAGERDSSKAIQDAIDHAAQGNGGAVIVPPGIYLCHDIQMRPRVRLTGSGTWGYRDPGSCVLQLNPDAADAACILNLNDAFSCTVENLCLRGCPEDNSHITHGFSIDFDARGMARGSSQEDIPTLIDCKVEDFSGDGFHFRNIWCFRMSGCQARRCRNGLDFGGADGFIINCWFSKNREWGIRCRKDCAPTASTMVTACRIEWNAQGGILLTGAARWQIANCNFDRNGGPAVSVIASHERRCPQCHSISMTGNIFHRNGDLVDEEHSAHLFLSDAFNLTITGNVFLAGANDMYTGTVAPKHAVISEKLKSAVISGNVMQNGCTESLFVDRGSDESVVCQNNVGCQASSNCYIAGKYFMPVKDE